MFKGIINTCKEKKILPFVFVWLIFLVALFLKGYGDKVNDINATMLAFSYEYGFISRGLIGTIYQLLDIVLPFDMLNYTWVMRFTKAVTVVFYLILFAFILSCLFKCSKKLTEPMKYAIIFFSIWAIPMFVSQYNFGRLDVYCVMLSLLGAILLIYEKAEWLVIVFSALGVMVHQGNVFMFLNIILILLFYKMLSTEGKKQRKYLILFVLSFLVASALFIYFEFFSHFDGESILENIVATATALCDGGKYHQDVIDHEILGIDLTEREWKFRLQNFIQFPIFVVLMLPHIILTVKLFRNIISSAETKKDKWKYFFVSIGAATIIPDLILKCDYGRWMFAIICYYCVVILALLAMKDKIVEREFLNLTTTLNKKSPASILLLAYPIVFQPLWDVAICYLVARWAGQINDLFLHWW